MTFQEDFKKQFPFLYKVIIDAHDNRLEDLEERGREEVEENSYMLDELNEIRVFLGDNPLNIDEVFEDDFKEFEKLKKEIYN